MATSKEYMEFLMDQLSDFDGRVFDLLQRQSGAIYM